jgi:hypothetical protein
MPYLRVIRTMALARSPRIVSDVSCARLGPMDASTGGAMIEIEVRDGLYQMRGLTFERCLTKAEFIQALRRAKGVNRRQARQARQPDTASAGVIGEFFADATGAMPPHPCGRSG